MVFEHEGQYGSRWETIRSIAQKLGCAAEALRKWVKRAEIDAGRVGGAVTVVGIERAAQSHTSMRPGCARRRRVT
jgi:transposase-like protein